MWLSVDGDKTRNARGNMNRPGICSQGSQGPLASSRARTAKNGLHSFPGRMEKSWCSTDRADSMTRKRTNVWPPSTFTATPTISGMIFHSAYMWIRHRMDWTRGTAMPDRLRCWERISSPRVPGFTPKIASRTNHKSPLSRLEALPAGTQLSRLVRDFSPSSMDGAKGPPGKRRCRRLWYVTLPKKEERGNGAKAP